MQSVAKSKRMFELRKIKNNAGRSGQAILIAIISIGGVILGATTLAGFLLLYQINATTDAVNSVQAIFAADTGINWALYDYYKSAVTLPGSPAGTLSNGAVASTTCYDSENNTSDCSDTAVTVNAIAKGSAGNSSRAFLLNLAGATSTLP